MNEIFQAAVVGLVQGLTEFLPVSSSAHLILVPSLLHWPAQGLAFDIVVHVATLLAVLWHYRHDCLQIARGLFRAQPSDEKRLGWWLILSPLPLVLLTLALGSEWIHQLRTPEVIAYSCIGFSLPLIFAQYLSKDTPNENQFAPTWILLVMAMAQALAVIPGASRSGVTLAAAACCGLSLSQSARYAFLMAIPTIVLAFGYELIHLNGALNGHVPSLLIGFFTAFVTALLCIRAFCLWVARIGLIPFVIYRILLGALLLIAM